MKYQLVGLGGTFDHLHRGHEAFLQFAAQLSEQLLVGLTTDQLTEQKLFPQSIEKFATRQKTLQAFCEQNHIAAEITPLHDVYGPTVKNSKVEALAVTPETFACATAINVQRREQNLPELPIHQAEMLYDQSHVLLSSTRIRQGFTDREGNVYATALHETRELLPSQRQFFQVAQGPIVSGPTPSTELCCVVGDYVLQTFQKNTWPYHLGIFDGLNERQPFAQHFSATHEVENAAGQIRVELTKMLMQLIEPYQSSGTTLAYLQPMHLYVHGEEDLATVALVILCPLGTQIYYGQRQEGMVELLVTEKLKQLFFQALLS